MFDPVSLSDPTGLSAWFEKCVGAGVPDLNNRLWFPLGPDHPKSKIDPVFAAVLAPIWVGPLALGCMAAYKT